MKRKYSLLLLIVITAVSNSVAQQHKADSIEALLKTDIPDTTRAIAMVYKAMYYETVDTARSKQLYREAIEYAEKRKLNYAAGFALHYSMFMNTSKGNYDVHRDDMEKAMHYLSFSNTSMAKLTLGLVMNDKASMFYTKEIYDSAALWYLKSIEILEKENRYDKIAGTYVNLSAVYEVLNLKDKQKEYTLKGLEAAKKSGRRHDLFSSYSIVSQYYYGINDYKKALVYSDSSATYFTDAMGSNRIKLYYLVRAQAFNGIEKYDSSVFNYNKVYETAKAQGDEWQIPEPLIRMGYGYWKLGQKGRAEKFLKDGIEMAEKNNLNTFKKTGYELLSKFYEENGDYKKSLEAYKKYYEANDSLQNEERKKVILDLDKKYETEKKEKQLILQQSTIKQKNTLNYIFGGSIAALLLISLLSYRTYQQKRKLQQQKITELEKEKQLFATQSLLKGQQEERNRLAKDLHDGLGGLLSGVKLQLGAMKGNLILSEEHGRMFNNALGKLDESIDEMRRVAHNMMPEALMKLGLQQALQDYCDGLSASQPFTIKGEFYGLEKRMDSATEVVVYRIVQELLNNAVKHSGATSILAQVMRNENNLTITVEDDGKGFDKETELSGAGLRNVRSRVDYLKGQMDVQSVQGKGTSVHIDCTIEPNG